LFLRNKLAALLLLLLLCAGYFTFTRVRTPAGQLSLTDLDRAGFLTFEQMFDDAAGGVRVVGLFSPT
jgi:hypothetical protein